LCVGGKTSSEDPYNHRHIWVTDLKNKKYYQLTFGRTEILQEYPAWSPDEKWIAYINNDYRYGKAQICIISSDGKKQAVLTKWGKYQGPLSWSPDGKRILFAKWGGKATYRAGPMADIWTAEIKFSDQD
jgi:Tol biopolymer transport system component